MQRLVKSKANFGTAPVFLTAISTILGAVMFLRFGYAVGNLGFAGTVIIIVIGHLVTIPTAMAIAEIATNQKVEGGGEYYIISRSFGINIGASIGVALYFSQAISIAFYIIAFAEAFDPLYALVNDYFGWDIHDKRIISIPAIIILSYIMLTQGANLGMKLLYVVVSTLVLSLLFFFTGSTDYQITHDNNLINTISNPDSFFVVFAIIFPAFTGMTAGVGLSGDLKDPKKSIPWGTVSATAIGMVIYVIIAWKLSISASPEDLAGDQLVMGRIAAFNQYIPMIAIGLAAATISSALGSIMVAPRTLQALANDKTFQVPSINNFLSKGSKKNNEPVNATLVTVILALFFVSVGSIDTVAKVISMFFMVTYGAICTISFFQHFAADPSYRPSFRSKWYISLLGAVMCIYLMFKMEPAYALASIIVMVIIYFSITYMKNDKEGMAKIFQGVIFQLIRQIQVFIQKADKDDDNWRPTIICISDASFERPAAFDLLRWMSHRYGFGTYIHYINGYFSKKTNVLAKAELARLIRVADLSKSNVYVDTMVSPSYTTAIAQALQLPSVSGKDINMILFEYSKDDTQSLDHILENIPLIEAAEFDSCILSSCEKGFGIHKEIHIWIKTTDYNNANLMILLGYVVLGHPQWKKAEIKIFAITKTEELVDQKNELLELIKTGRLPISAHNIQIIELKDETGVKDIINDKSKDADLTVLGFRIEAVKQQGVLTFEGYEKIGNILHVHSRRQKDIS